MAVESFEEKSGSRSEREESGNILDKPEDFEWGIEAINRLSKMEKYLGKAKLDADLAYLEMKKEIEAQAGELAAFFFGKARSSEGEERTQYARALEKLGVLVGEEKYGEILRPLLTNKESVKELAAMGGREKSEAKKKTGFWAKWMKRG